MTKERQLKIGEVARFTKLSTRTLRYYEEMGLIQPQRTANAYRLYSQSDLLRLQQVLIGRALGLPLEEIKRSLDDPEFDLQASLRKQRRALLERVAESKQMIAAIDEALERPPEQGERTMNVSKLFDGFDSSEHEAEVKERWGETAAYKESSRRTSRYTQAQWQELKAELNGIWDDGAAAMQAGVAPTSETALELVERHRLHIDRWFYPLSQQMHKQLATMWEADPRFSANIDQHGEGLTQWFAAAVRAR